jgi:hypothetical protein
MSDEARIPHGVMEGKGAYNRHAKLPAGGAALAIPLLENAVQRVAIDHGDRPLVIADYGSSQGKNSLAPMRIAIEGLRSRAGANRPIFVYHIDQPSNDFNSLFEVLDSDPDRYLLDDPHVCPCAIGRSFYGQVLPRGYVDLAWSSYAAVWLSRVPGPVPGHFIAFRGQGEPLPEFAAQGAKDWEAFLSLRALEVRPGGRLVVVLPAVQEDGTTGFEHLMNEANEVLGEMVAAGVLLAEERARMALGSYPRRKSELLAPFKASGQVQGLTVEDCEVSVLADAAWADYQRDGDKGALVAKHALFFRSIFVPSLASALRGAGDAETCRAFGDRMEKGLRARLAKQPVAMNSFVSTMVLVKQAQA